MTRSHFVNVDGITLHYLEAGQGDPVLLLHGWPTSSFLWRNVLVEIARTNRVIALDLPGFGKSDKPLDASYSFRFHLKVLDGFLDQLGIDRLSLTVHDLGGPIGLYWACHRLERVQKLALLNTVVYPQMSWAVILFVLGCRIPGLRSLLASPFGLRQAMRIGIADRKNLTDEVVRGVQEPFQSQSARKALLKAGYGLHPKGFKTISELLPTFRGPVRILYGAKDWILPEVKKTMERVAKDLPQAQMTVLPECGHFLQEEAPQEIGRQLSEFFATSKVAR